MVVNVLDYDDDHFVFSIYHPAIPSHVHEGSNMTSIKILSGRRWWQPSQREPLLKPSLPQLSLHLIQLQVRSIPSYLISLLANWLWSIQDRPVETVGFPNGPHLLRSVINVGPVCHGVSQDTRFGVRKGVGLSGQAHWHVKPVLEDRYLRQWRPRWKPCLGE
jgi:hypothetical protein